MKEAIKILEEKRKTLQQMIDAEVGETFDEGELFQAELKQKLSEIETALNLISSKPPVSGWAGGLLKTKGTEFVEHYPSMFTEDTEWWAQKLDEHFVWNEDKVIDFVNWYIELHKLDFRYTLENRTIIESFKNGDDAFKWH